MPFMSTARRRRSFQFGLATMFVVVTGFACWLAHVANRMHDCRAFIANEIAAREQHPHQGFWSDATAARKPRFTAGTCAGHAVVGWRGWILGDPNSRREYQRRRLYAADLDRVRTARTLFPEATIKTVHVFDFLLVHGESVQTPP